MNRDNKLPGPHGACILVAGDSVIKELSDGVAKERSKAEKEGLGAQGRGVALERMLEGGLSEKVTLE